MTTPAVDPARPSRGPRNLRALCPPGGQGQGYSEGSPGRPRRIRSHRHVGKRQVRGTKYSLLRLSCLAFFPRRPVNGHPQTYPRRALLRDPPGSPRNDADTSKIRPLYGGAVSRRDRACLLPKPSPRRSRPAPVENVRKRSKQGRKRPQTAPKKFTNRLTDVLAKLGLATFGCPGRRGLARVLLRRAAERKRCNNKDLSHRPPRRRSPTSGLFPRGAMPDGMEVA